MINPEHLPKDIKSNNIVASVINNAEPFKALEREMICHILHKTNWKYSECAKKLRVSRTTLWRKMKEHEINKKRDAH
ncbi:MAG: helix-turn-helix domain-containing protein [Nitrospinota bacterium]